MVRKGVSEPKKENKTNEHKQKGNPSAISRLTLRMWLDLSFSPFPMLFFGAACTGMYIFFFFKQPELYLVVDWWWLLHILLRVLTTVLLINAPFLCVCLSLFPLSPPFLVCHACEWLLCFSGIVPLSLLAQCVASPMVLGPSWCSCCTLLENWLLPSLNV